MNAYELAKELDACFTKADWEYVDDCVNMLRQQADRIAELEKRNKPPTEPDFLAEMQKTNAKPVAYIDHISGKPKLANGFYVVSTPYDIPLYTTPQIKELSDEEIDLKWWISSFEHLKALGGGINDEMETKLKEMKERLKKTSEK